MGDGFTYELGVIGAGNMAEAIVRGVLRGGSLEPARVVASDVSPQRRELFSKELGVRAVEDNAEAARSCRVVLLSVKPQQMAAALAGIAGAADPRALVVSIAAGVGTAFIERHLGGPAGAGRWRVVRSMPNTPVLVGEGMVALARGAHATEQDVAAARRLFEAAASVVEVPEDRMDAVTAVSGSGPAYVFYLAEQMARAAAEMGLTPEQGRQLTAKTILGAARMLAATDEAPQELRRKVTSPGGTTQAAITHMERNGLAGIVIDAMKAAERRGKELGQ